MITANDVRELRKKILKGKTELLLVKHGSNLLELESEITRCCHYSTELIWDQSKEFSPEEKKVLIDYLISLGYYVSISAKHTNPPIVISWPE